MTPDVHWIRNIADAERPSGRRILLLTAYYPPRTAIGGARWEGFAGFLAEAGWSLDVLLETPAKTEVPDMSRVSSLPSSVRIAMYTRPKLGWHRALLRFAQLFRRSSATAPTSSSSLATANIGEDNVPRLRAFAREFVTWRLVTQSDAKTTTEAQLLALRVATGVADIVVSSGPPHYVHVAGAEVARRLNLPHVVDLRDPWMGGSLSQSIWQRKTERELAKDERRVISAAALTITNTEPARQVLARRFPEVSDRIVAIPNGSDLPLQLKPASELRGPFHIVHTGSLYLDRDPRPFLRAVAQVCKRRRLGPHDLHVTFMGPTVTIAGLTLEECAEQAGIGSYLSVLPLGTRDEARALLQNAAMAVAFQGATLTQIPAKVFEYVAYPLWLLALVGNKSATGELLEGTEAIVLEINDDVGIARAIEDAFDAHKRTGRPDPIGAAPRFSREHQARLLIRHLETCIGLRENSLPHARAR